jgi:glucosamine 6-phosphate synthetase-like amidotransferase/phosphosugar isomerase protein
LSDSQLGEIFASFANRAVVRGVDSWGVSYIGGWRVVIQKAPGSLADANFMPPVNARVVMAHCRRSFQGDPLLNENNHPFYGETLDGTRYALAHNGILADLRDLRIKHALPKPPTDTDTYGAVQLLNTERTVDLQTLKFVCENLNGSYIFTILDERENLFLCRGDAPVFLVHFRALGLYVYMSTRDLFEEAIQGTELCGAYMSSNVELAGSGAGIVPISKGDILRISAGGELARCRFNFNEARAIKHNWYIHEPLATPELMQRIGELNNE